MIVRAGDNPPARAAAAAAAGARTVLLADPRKRPLAAMPAGRVGVPVIGVTGEAAEEVLREKAGAEASSVGVEHATETGSRPSSRRSPRTGRLPRARRSPTSWPPGPRWSARPDGDRRARGRHRRRRRARGRRGRPARGPASRDADAGAAGHARVRRRSRRPAGGGAGAGLLRPDPVLPGLVDQAAAGRRASRSSNERRDAALRPPQRRVRPRPTPTTLDLQPGDAQSVTVTPSRRATPRRARARAPARLEHSTGGLAGLASLGRAWRGGRPGAGRAPGARSADPTTACAGCASRSALFERGDPLAGEGTRIVLANSLELVLLKGNERRATPDTSPAGHASCCPPSTPTRSRRACSRSLGDGTYRFRATARAPRQRRATVVLSEPFQP